MIDEKINYTLNRVSELEYKTKQILELESSIQWKLYIFKKMVLFFTKFNTLILKHQIRKTITFRIENLGRNLPQ
jgi:hypothetical protein